MRFIISRANLSVLEKERGGNFKSKKDNIVYCVTSSVSANDGYDFANQLRVIQYLEILLTLGNIHSEIKQCLFPQYSIYPPLHTEYVYLLVSDISAFSHLSRLI